MINGLIEAVKNYYKTPNGVLKIYVLYEDLNSPSLDNIEITVNKRMVKLNTLINFLNNFFSDKNIILYEVEQWQNTN